MLCLTCNGIEAKRQTEDGTAGGAPGYAWTDDEGRACWQAAEEFESRHLVFGDHHNGNSIGRDLALSFIVEFRTWKEGEKTTLAFAKLRNGYELVASSSCVDPDKYNAEMGAKICKERILDQVYFMLGGLLQTARNPLLVNDAAKGES